MADHGVAEHVLATKAQFASRGGVQGDETLTTKEATALARCTCVCAEAGFKQNVGLQTTAQVFRGTNTPTRTVQTIDDAVIHLDHADAFG